jgi:putative hydrolase of the HAD superfamily
MKYIAVIFDLFGTLIYKLSLRESTSVLRQMASVLSAPSDDFINGWFGTFNERGLGVFQSTEVNLEHICQKLGVPLEGNKIKVAARINLDYMVRSIRPRKDAGEVLTYLKSHGYKTGLVSNCSSSVPNILKSIPFTQLIDVAIFSAIVRMQKPDVRIYQLAAEKLVVKTECCLYIGDGDEHELTGAAEAGMHPVLISDPYEDSSDVHRVNAEQKEWHGPVISSLKGVLDLLG